MSYLTDHAAELFDRSEYSVTGTAFLSPAEQREIFDALPRARGRLVFWGGALNAARRCAFFVPEWMIDGVGDAIPAPLASLPAFAEGREAAAAIFDRDGELSGDRIRVARVTGSGFSALRHRDFMGAILNLGLKRETVGDIVLSGDRACDVYCVEAAARLMAEELHRIGRDGVTVEVRSVRPGERIELEFDEMVVILASMRLDCAVREFASVSREAAQRMITAGEVEHNHKVAEDISAHIAPGDTVSVRGAGKYRIGEQEGETRKERIRLRVYRYK